MVAKRQTVVWIIGFVCFLAGLFWLRGILLPFVAGIILAYFLDPVCDRLEKIGCSRTVATTIITACFFAVLMLILFITVPLVHSQIIAFAVKIPTYLKVLEDVAGPAILFIQQNFDGVETLDLRQTIDSNSGDIALWVSQFFGRLLSGIDALVSILALIVITPVVTFYLLRDWDRIVGNIYQYLPRAKADEIRGQIILIDQALAALVRGQAIVCILLGLFYGIGLTIIGLEFGLIIGLLTGLVSFVPYFGMLIGFFVGVTMAIAQFGDLTPIFLVVGVFVVGQFIEGNFITPRVIGERVGLHPVWIIFALLAGGSMFGFVGVLLAVPVAAITAVLARYFLSQYLGSELYTGDETLVDTGDRGNRVRDTYKS